jgi:hypothetical protein
MQRALETVIDKLGLPATNEDVAEFMQAHFSDLADQRRSMVESAIEAAQARDVGGKSAPRIGDARSNDDVGFAPTILSSNEPGVVPSVNPDRGAPTRRASQLARPSPPPPKEESKLTLGSAALEMEEVRGLPKRRGWIWAALVVCLGAGGLYGWRTNAFDRVRALLAPPTRAVASPEPAPAPPPMATYAPVAAPPVVSTTPPIPTPPSSAAASQAPSFPSSAPNPAMRPAHGTRPVAPPLATSAPAAEPPPAPPPPTSPSDEDNPYN